MPTIQVRGWEHYRFLEFMLKTPQIGDVHMGQIYASSILADGKLYYVSRNGRTLVLAAES